MGGMAMNEFIGFFWKNSEYRFDDWGLTFWGWVVVALLINWAICWVSKKIGESNEEDEQERYKTIKALGYSDMDDIQVFCNLLDLDLDDFIASKGVRKQYEIFSEGKTSDFMEAAIAKKKADEAEAAGHSSGLLTGLVIGSAIRR
jgi:hypothetical protein